MSARSRFCQLALAQLGKPVVWGARGPEAFDCSGLVAWCLRGVGGPDLRATHNAQLLYDETRPLLDTEDPLPGDLEFFGATGKVSHVAIWFGPDRTLSADGATSRVLSLAEARANPLARVVIHSWPWRRDAIRPLHRNTFLDALDLVTR